MLTALLPHPVGPIQGPSIAVRTPRGALLAVTELRSDIDGTGISVPLPREPAVVIVVQLLQGSATILDLRAEPRLSLPQCFHCLLFYLSEEALIEYGCQRGGALNCTRRAVDPCLQSLARALLPALSNPQRADRSFVAQVLYALAAHITHRYGGMRLSTVHPRVRLAPWQERRAKEFMQTRLQGVSIAELARECKLSPDHFARAFRHCTGLSPHRWLLAARVERAKALILSSPATLLEVALCCGFSDQSHFSRVFAQLTGMTPATWRRSRAPQERADG